MNINHTTLISFNGRIKKPKLTPVSSYNGPRLQLTEGDLEKIAKLEALKKNEIEKQAPILKSLDIYLHKSLSFEKREEIRAKKKEIKDKISFFDNEIENIKKQRIAIQRAEFENQEKNVENKLDIEA